MGNVQYNGFVVNERKVIAQDDNNNSFFTGARIGNILGRKDSRGSFQTEVPININSSLSRR